MTFLEDNGSDSCGSEVDHVSVVTIISPETVFTEIMDGQKPDIRFPNACWKCGKIKDANNGGFDLIGQ